MLSFESAVEKILMDLEKTSSEYWNVSRDAAEFLYILAKSLGSRKILEVGTSSGYSAIWLALALKEVAPGDGKVFTVESHEGRFLLAAENFKLSGLSESIRQLKGHAPEILLKDEEVMAGDFDLVFLDATKNEHILYVEAIFPLVRSGGIIVADNVLSHSEAMSSYIEHVQAMETVQSVILPIGTGMMVSVKK